MVVVLCKVTLTATPCCLPRLVLALVVIVK